MNIPRLGSIADGLIHETEIPICWKIMSHAVPSHELLKIHDSNRQILQLLFKENFAHDLEASADDAGREIHRLDLKLDLLINLVGTLLSSEIGIPDRRKVWLGSDGLQIFLDSDSGNDTELIQLPLIPLPEYEAKSSTSGCLMKISLFLDAHFPQPVCFLASAVVVQHETAGRLMVATFQNMDQEVQNLLEKYIFQQHRRIIASTRTED